MRRALVIGALLVSLVTAGGRALAQPAPASRSVYDLLKYLYNIPNAPSCSVTFTTVGTSAVRLNNNDPKRFTFFIMNMSSGTCAYSFNGQVTTSQGISLGGSGGYFFENYKDDGVLPTYDHWAICTNAGETILVESCSLN